MSFQCLWSYSFKLIKAQNSNSIFKYNSELCKRKILNISQKATMSNNKTFELLLFRSNDVTPMDYCQRSHRGASIVAHWIRPPLARLSPYQSHSCSASNSISCCCPWETADVSGAWVSVIHTGDHDRVHDTLQWNYYTWPDAAIWESKSADRRSFTLSISSSLYYSTVQINKGKSYIKKP